MTVRPRSLFSGPSVLSSVSFPSSYPLFISGLPLMESHRYPLLHCVRLPSALPDVFIDILGGPSWPLWGDEACSALGSHLGSCHFRACSLFLAACWRLAGPRRPGAGGQQHLWSGHARPCWAMGYSFLAPFLGTHLPLSRQSCPG